MDFTDTLNSIAAMQPMSAEHERRYIMETEIHPQMARWGFLDRYSETLEMPERQLATHEEMRRLIRGRSSIIALVGQRGVGKTAMSAQLAIECAWRNYRSKMQEVGRPVVVTSFVYRKTRDIVSKFKSLFSDYGATDTEQLIRAFDYLATQYEVLVIDELHECDEQKLMRRILTDLVDRRYAGLRHTILISNQSPADFAASAGDSIVSRLNERGAILECTWPSFR